MGAQGTTTIAFGADPGVNEASVAVTGQASIVADSLAEAFVMEEVLGTKTANDHGYMNLLVRLTCGTIVAATGFTIYAKSTEKMTGSFTVKWVWN